MTAADFPHVTTTTFQKQSFAMAQQN